MFTWLGQRVVRHPRIVIGVWVVLFILGAIFAPGITTFLKAGGFAETDSEAAIGEKLLKEELGLSASFLNIVFSSQNLTVDDPRFGQEVGTALAGLSKIKEVNEVTSFFNSGNPRIVSEDRHTTYVNVGLNVDLDEARSLMPEIKDSLNSAGLKNVAMVISGHPAVFSDIESISTRDLRKAEMYAFPLALIALILAFGSLVAAGLPLVIGGVSLVITLGIISLLSQLTDISMFVINIVSMLGIGIAIDYSLLMVDRFREELRSHSLEQSVVTTVSTAGKAIFYSAVTTIIGLLGLISFQYMMLRSLGIGGAIVVIISLAASLTLLPAALSMLGHRVNTLRILPQSQRAKGSFWHGLATWVMRHPVMVMVVVVPFLFALGSPFLGVNLGGVGITSLPESTPARQGYDILKKEFGEGETSPILIAVHTEGNILGAKEIDTIYDFTRDIAHLEGVSRVDSIVTLDPGISKEQYQLMYANPSLIDNPSIRNALKKSTSTRATVISVISPQPPVSQEANKLVRKIREIKPDGVVDVYVTGLTAEIMDIVSRMYHDFPRVLLFILLATYFTLLVLFKSAILPLKAILMNVMSILASYGALVFIFQQGHFSGLLNFTPVGSTESTLVIIMFCILFGLSMDYEVFLLTRVREYYLETKDNTASVALGLERTGRIITSAALIMVLVAGSFGFTDILLVKAMGLGIAIAILLDATIVRALLAPATMRLLGSWNWWLPAFLRRLFPWLEP